ncbi:MAG: transglutaminase family protein [Bacteroidota bacterium]|nr:transglutaminase family protein [Candidatus Kapabacteria bacterium]MDW8220272.1 transglutaminase family protein [Bacteroidota bacterium]
MLPDTALYLQPTYFLDCNHEDIVAYAHRYTSPDNAPIENAIALYRQIRDEFLYNPYILDFRPQGLKASDMLKRNYGHCVNKAVLLAATARVVGIPSRLAFFNVKNHIVTEKIERFLQTNVLVFHGCTELWLEGRWVKATPAFNADLCRKLNVAVLEFDGTEDSIFQQYDRAGNVFMEYVHEYGSFHDLPYDLMISQFRKHYGFLLSEKVLQSMGLVIDLNVLMQQA